MSGCRPTLGPPSAQGPFARSGRYPSRRGHQRHVSGHYPALVATTSPCARPKPSRRLRFPYTAGLRRLSLLPAGSWPFPTLSPRSLYRRLDLYPAVSLRCICPFLPEGPRPHLNCHKFGTPNNRRNAASTANIISGLQSFLHVQAPMLARPSGCTHHRATVHPGRPGRLHHAEPMGLPAMGCDIATCLNRATGTAGLSPAGSRPCRPLRQSFMRLRLAHER
jgi:hypothetical protein